MEDFILSDWYPWLNNMDVECAMFVIDDALCMGFEFKVENHTLYYREVVE